jgi:hypothetical protein
MAVERGMVSLFELSTNGNGVRDQIHLPGCDPAPYFHEFITLIAGYSTGSFRDAKSHQIVNSLLDGHNFSC